MSEHMPNKIAGAILHQYVDGNLITIRKPEAKIQVTIKTQRLRKENPRSTSEKKEGSPDVGK